jgi:hypothetical protein
MTGEKNQQSFDFFEDNSTVQEMVEAASVATESVEISISDEVVDDETVETLSNREIRQALAAWVLKREPTGIGFKVPTRISKFQADIAAFWSTPKGRYLNPECTVIIEIRRDREECWPECSHQDTLLPTLRSLKEKREELRAWIREHEPELRRDDNLFDEYVDWDYDLSSKREYHRCMKQIRETEKALYNGSRFEMIRRGGVANLLYLAVPDGTVSPDEIADGWGLIYWKNDLSIEVIRKPDTISCKEKARLHLIQKITEANMKDFMQAHGIRRIPDGRFGLTTPPRKRKIRREIP